ncbi:unnamed protein product [marine sediment metagenome]|uniref:Uncharacterized protein n=1 Tax=marine sediment metagenome TaxID=412755 RepID=X0RXA9_9ZZZZ
MDDLYLKFIFTDRGGRRVFNIYEVEPTDVSVTEGVEILGQIRLSPDHDDGDVDWAEATPSEE